MKIKKGIEIRTDIDDGKSPSPGAAVTVGTASLSTSALSEDMNNTAFFYPATEIELNMDPS